MADKRNQPIIPSDFTGLKQLVKNICLGRGYTNSVYSYGGASYDYATTPSKGGKILEEHYTKLYVPLSKINPNGLVNNSKGSAIDYSSLDKIAQKITYLNNNKSTEQNGATGCTAAACTGLCTTGCYSGCAGSCKGGCYTGCSGNCKGGCKGGCEDACSSCGNDCSHNCSIYCGSACSSTCEAPAQGW